ncbi:hypothetical protein BJ875DRAFT_546301 [Amylocarpus encephaloides]|uniref:Uncharacterized protein n=1 Tax=Amylocarpus encephaloides TaxID=45428 RepID=A0A9P7YBL2_9HELO|nr:hypothetical protein BJ875DRAFT_546301 [Amylocarpus encephaloides]
MKYTTLILMVSAITSVFASPIDCNQNDRSGHCVKKRDFDQHGPAAGLVARQGFIGAETHRHHGGEVEKRQGFIGAETHRHHGGEVEKRDRPDCGSPFSPPCPPATVEKRQGFIGAETHFHHPPAEAEKRAAGDRHPDCGSPFSPPCPPS